MAFQISKNSWLNFSDLLIAPDDQAGAAVTFWDLPEFPPVLPQRDDTYITIDQRTVGRLDLIAYEAYSDPDLWWVIALANDISLIPSEITIGRKLRLPPKNYVSSFIQEGSSK